LVRRSRFRIPPWNADVAALTTAAVFGLLLWWIFYVVSQAGTLQKQVRTALDARAATLRAQTDQEQAVRGYLITGQRRYLPPYVDGDALMAQRLADQRKDLRALGSAIDPGAMRALDDEEIANHEWRLAVADHLVADRSASNVAALSKFGIPLGQRFRDDNDDIVAALLQTARASDDQFQNVLRQIEVTGVLGALGLIVLVRLLTVRGERLWRAAERQRTLYQNEKRIADSLQEAFLQRELPEVTDLGMHAVYMPAEQQARVGGDWYDAVPAADGRLFVSVGDVSGHGIEAAVAMSRVRQTLLTLAALGQKPDAILEHVNRTLLLQGATMVTALCCYIDPNSREIEYGNAGHPPPVVAGPDLPARIVPGRGVPLGIVPDASYATFSLRAPAGGLLVFYTDGLIEYKRDLIAGERRLLDAVESVAASDSVDPALALRDAMFSDGRPFDDVAVLTVRFASTTPADGGAPPEVEALKITRAPLGETTRPADTETRGVD
jgi:serine phosphatase RsbU (regulator of sigma subunit)